MAAASSRQKRVTGRVMHEFKHGELKSGRGKGGKVKNRRQAIAIALEEAGASKYESGRRNRRNLRRTESKEARGRTARSRNVKANPMSAPTANARAARRWRAKTRANRPHGDTERRRPAPASLTDIPARNFTPRPRAGTSWAGPG